MTTVSCLCNQSSLMKVSLLTLLRTDIPLACSGRLMCIVFGFQQTVTNCSFYTQLNSLTNPSAVKVSLFRSTLHCALGFMQRRAKNELFIFLTNLKSVDEDAEDLSFLVISNQNVDKELLLLLIQILS